MEERIIEKHDFEEAKLAIKAFSEQTTTDLSFSQVNDKKGVGEWLGDAIFGGGIGTSHKVTGKELNDLTVQVQTHLRSVNQTQIKLIKEFGQVYNALEALDNDYIQGILISIKATEETSERIEATQEQIKKIVEGQKKTLEVLKNFKQKIDAYKHLGDIDTIWSDCQKWHKEISSLSNSVSGALSTTKENAKAISAVKESLKDTDSKVAQLLKSLSVQIDRIDEVIAFSNELETITHLNDIDDMWDSLANAQVSLKNLCAELDTVKQGAEKQQQDIEKILVFVDSVSRYEHLKEIDVIWKKVESHSKELDALNEQSKSTVEDVNRNRVAIAGLVDYKQELSAIDHLNEVDNIWEMTEGHKNQIRELQNQCEESRSLILHNKEIFDKSLATEKEMTNSALQQINKKIQYAYWMAGGTMVLALVELLVIIFR